MELCGVPREKVEYKDNGPKVHIGAMLRAFIKDNGLNQAETARRSHMSPQALSGMLNRPSMQLEVLLRLCAVLKHDFFADISVIMARYAADAPGVPEVPDRRIELSIRMTPEQLDRATKFLEGLSQVPND